MIVAAFPKRATALSIVPGDAKWEAGTVAWLAETNMEEEVENCQVVKEGMENRDGVVVMALASHLRGPCSGHEWVKLVVGSLLCSKRFLSGFLVFPSPQKSTFPNSNSIGCRTSLKTTFG